MLRRVAAALVASAASTSSASASTARVASDAASRAFADASRDALLARHLAASSSSSFGRRGAETATVASSSLLTRLQPPLTARGASVFSRHLSSSGGARGGPRPVVTHRSHDKPRASSSSKTRKTSEPPEPPPRHRQLNPEPEIDGMPRYPELSIPGTLRFLDYFGTASFAMTGTLAAAARGMDLLGCVVVGTITAVGGGTVRDLLLGRGRRAFWMEEIEYLWICLGTGVLTFLSWPTLRREFGVDESDWWVEAWDAIGVGAFCVIGAQNGETRRYARD
jgi:hypothetical protein|eukprot:31461-Pelagococcus_subviridis.AAC.7